MACLFSLAGRGLNCRDGAGIRGVNLSSHSRQSTTMKLFAYISILLLSVIPRVWAQTPARDSAFLNSVHVFKDVEVVGKSPPLRSGLDKNVFPVNQRLLSTPAS